MYEVRTARQPFERHRRGNMTTRALTDGEKLSVLSWDVLLQACGIYHRFLEHTLPGSIFIPGLSFTLKEKSSEWTARYFYLSSMKRAYRFGYKADLESAIPLEGKCFPIACR